MSGYIEVVNWREFQHYKERHPLWVKLYHRLLDDHKYDLLPESSKLLLLTFYMLAAKTNNRIPNDLDWIRRKGCLSTKPNMQPLEDAGFIHIRYQDASKMLGSEDKEQSKNKRKNIGTEVPFDAEFSADSVDPIFLTFKLHRKGTYDLRESKVREYEATFPGFDVRREIRALWQWSEDNPAKRKKNIPSFLTRNLNRKHESGRMREKQLVGQQTIADPEILAQLGKGKA